MHCCIYTLIICLLFLISGSLQLATQESKLLQHLLAQHSPDIRPLPNKLQGPTVVNVSIKIVQILDIDEKNEILSLLVWAYIYWEDTTFTWDPGAHNQIKSLLFPAQYIWTPDIILYNTQEIGSGFHLGLPQKEDDLHFNVLATANGSMRLAFPHLFKSMCKLNMSEYPFDMQSCPMLFGSWSHNQSEVDINIVGNALSSEEQYKESNKAWQMTDSACTKFAETCSFDSSKRLCPVASCYVALKRKAWFEVISYTLPTIIIAALSIMVFMVPPEAGKRMEVGITLILCVAVYLSLVNKKMPSTSDAFPLVSKFYGCVIVEITIAMVCSCFCLHIYDPEGLRLLHFPNYLRTLAFGLLARLTFYQHKGGKPNRIHPTNAEIKIVARRKSMVTANNNLQLLQQANSIKRLSVKPATNDQFGLKMEDIDEQPENEMTNLEEELKQKTDVSNDEKIEEEDQQQQQDIPLQDIEEESAEEIVPEQVIQGNTENRCDSGFGEPGESLSNRSSLLSSNSVHLPSDANSPTPVNETRCECGQEGCDGQGQFPCSNTGQMADADVSSLPGEVLTADDGRPGRERFSQVARRASSQSQRKERLSMKRAATTIFGESKGSHVSAGLVPKTLTARPYTDSVLSTWKKHRTVRNFQSTLRSRPNLRLEKEESEQTEISNRIANNTTDETTARNSVLGDNTNKSVSQNLIERTDSRFKTCDQMVASTSGEQSPKQNNTRKLSSRNSVQERCSEPSLSRQGSKQSLASKNSFRKTEEKHLEIINNSELGQNSNVEQTSRRNSKDIKSNDHIELTDIVDDEFVNEHKEVHDAQIHQQSTNLIESNCSKQTSLNSNGTDIVDEPNQETINNSDKESPRVPSSQESDNETENNSNDESTRKKAMNSSIMDPQILFARRNWNVVRDRMQRKITVKDVFGQILSPKETSPIVAIANVLLRDQRKYVMRTEWMTSAMIFNRFFIITLALAVFISVLAVFLQSSRLRV